MFEFKGFFKRYPEIIQVYGEFLKRISIIKVYIFYEKDPTNLLPQPPTLLRHIFPVQQ